MVENVEPEFATLSPDTSFADVILESPNVLVIEIGEGLMISETGGLDVYQVAVLESLKGDVLVGESINITFFGGTVSTGEVHIVATSVMCEYDPVWHQFSTRDGLFPVDRLDEIRNIIGWY